MMALMGKNLVKTNKVIKVEPEDILKIYKYAKYMINWQPDKFIEKLEEIYPYINRREYVNRVQFLSNDIKDGIRILVPANTIILPTYMRDKEYMVFKVYRSLIEHKTSDVIDINEFSLFDVYKVVDKPFGRLSHIDFSAWIEYRREIKSYGIKIFGISVVDRRLGRDFRDLLTGTVFGENIFDEELNLGYLKMIKQLQGVKYSDLPYVEGIANFGYEKGVLSGMLLLERDLTATLNLVHFLYSHEFDENDIIGWLFKHYSDNIKGLGCEFEKALSKLTGVLRLIY
jgi:hypothetical protein